MNARVETYSGVGNLADASTYLQGNVLPQRHREPGYIGGMASIDEGGGTLGVISLWDDTAAIEASDRSAAASRDRLIRLSGGNATVEVFGQVVSKIGDPPPQAGCPVRFLRFRLQSAGADESTDLITSDILPAIARSPGFRAVRLFTDTGSEQGLLVIIVSDEDAARTSEADFEARRADDAARGISFESISRRRVLLVDRR
jgi:heme-degrading monooxygenase HmoA